MCLCWCNHLNFSLCVGGVVHTHTTILVQVAFYGALHRMLKGAYNSGMSVCFHSHSVYCSVLVFLSSHTQHHVSTLPSFNLLLPPPPFSFSLYPLSFSLSFFLFLFLLFFFSPPSCRALKIRAKNNFFPHCWSTAEICWGHRYMTMVTSST